MNRVLAAGVALLAVGVVAFGQMSPDEAQQRLAERAAARAAAATAPANMRAQYNDLWGQVVAAESEYDSLQRQVAKELGTAPATQPMKVAMPATMPATMPADMTPEKLDAMRVQVNSLKTMNAQLKARMPEIVRLGLAQRLAKAATQPAPWEQLKIGMTEEQADAAIGDDLPYEKKTTIETARSKTIEWSAEDTVLVTVTFENGKIAIIQH